MTRQFDDLQLGSIEIFCLAAESGSFTIAARSAGLTPAAVSRSISRLEARLGVQLFTRTTRKMKLTDSGRTYFASCRAALAQLVEAEREVAGQQGKASGTLTITLPTTYGHHRILPLLPAFRALHPQVRVDVHLSNRNIDFAAEGFDLAIRARVQPDSNLVARKLEDAELVVVAAPSYLKRAGIPDSLEALVDHESIQFVLPRDGRPAPWLFKQSGKVRELQLSGNYCCSGDILGTATLATSGAGIAQMYRFVVQEELRNGSLVEILKSYGGCSRPFSLIYPHTRHVPLRVKVFIDFLLDRLTRPRAKSR